MLHGFGAGCCNWTIVFSLYSSPDTTLERVECRVITMTTNYAVTAVIVEFARPKTSIKLRE